MVLVFLNAQSTSMNIKNSADLKAAIQELENRKQLEKKQLVESFDGFKESLKPINLLKSTFNSVKETPGLGGLVVNTTLGMGAGLLSKRLMVG
jgi:radical SAM superfamily enzyme